MKPYATVYNKNKADLAVARASNSTERDGSVSSISATPLNQITFPVSLLSSVAQEIIVYVQSNVEIRWKILQEYK